MKNLRGLRQPLERPSPSHPPLRHDGFDRARRLRRAPRIGRLHERGNRESASGFSVSRSASASSRERGASELESEDVVSASNSLVLGIRGFPRAAGNDHPWWRHRDRGRPQRGRPPRTRRGHCRDRAESDRRRWRSRDRRDGAPRAARGRRSPRSHRPGGRLQVLSS